MRLLSFLTDLESQLRSADLLPSRQPCARLVDYTNATARLLLDDERSVIVRVYRLASGRFCLRVFLERGGESEAVKTLYPEVDSFSWSVGLYEVQKALEERFAAEVIADEEEQALKGATRQAASA